MKITPGTERGTNRKTGYLAFEAIGEEFVLCLSDKENLGDRTVQVSFVFRDHVRGITISQDGPARAVHTKEKNAVSVPHFNSGLNPNEKIRYLVSLDYQLNTLTLSHYGNSELYSISPPVVYTSTTKIEPLCYFSLYIYGQNAVEFYNVRTIRERIPSVVNEPEPPTHAEHHPAAADGKQQDKAGGRDRGSIKPPGKPEKGKRDTGFFGAMAGMVDVFGGVAPDDPPLKLEECQDDEDCEFRTRAPGPDVSAHFAAYRHRCLYGRTCKIYCDKNHPEREKHKQQFRHVKREKCKKGRNCSKQTDPIHRGKKSHPDMWDFMLPCKYGQACKDSKHAHQTKFYH